MMVNRRRLLSLTGAALAAAPFQFTSVKGNSSAQRKPESAIILVVDETIPFAHASRQFDVFRDHNKSLGLPHDEHMCFGLYSVGGGSKKYVMACAKTCNGWIANMRLNGTEKVAVMVWTRRLGPMLTLPLVTTADVRLARTSGHSRKFVSTILRAANQKPNGRHQAWLECCEALNGRSYHLLVDHGLKPLCPDELPGLRE